jgi:hypothetical protein
MKMGIKMPRKTSPGPLAPKEKKPPGPLTLEEKKQIELLVANGGTHHAVALKIGRDRKTVKAYATSPEAAEAIQELRGELADMYEGLARRMLDSITDEDIRKLDAYRRTVAAGISTDKVRLLRGQSTMNISAFELIVQRTDENVIQGILGKALPANGACPALGPGGADNELPGAEATAISDGVARRKKRGRRKLPIPTTDAT